MTGKPDNYGFLEVSTAKKAYLEFIAQAAYILKLDVIHICKVFDKQT